MLMFNVCPACGIYTEEKEVRPADLIQAVQEVRAAQEVRAEQEVRDPHAASRAFAICPHCEYAHPFLRLPLFIITGASGTGKSTLALKMAEQDQQCVHLETDILWRPEFNRPENDYRDFRNTCLRMAKNVAQGGKPVALYGSVVPSQFTDLPESRYFSQIHYMALVCEPGALAQRLRDRPTWRSSASPEFIENMLSFNRWFVENGAVSTPPITLLDTTMISLDETAQSVRAWIHSLAAAHPLEGK